VFNRPISIPTESYVKLGFSCSENTAVEFRSIDLFKQEISPNYYGHCFQTKYIVHGMERHNDKSLRAEAGKRYVYIIIALWDITKLSSDNNNNNTYTRRSSCLHRKPGWEGMVLTSSVHWRSYTCCVLSLSVWTLPLRCLNTRTLHFNGNCRQCNFHNHTNVTSLQNRYRYFFLVEIVLKHYSFKLPSKYVRTTQHNNKY
jgi:hypothetical protein